MISIADQVFDELERDILSGVYERDEILTEIKLSEQLGVSRTPIREALRRLAREAEAALEEVFRRSAGWTVARPESESKDTMFPGMAQCMVDRISCFRASSAFCRKISVISIQSTSYYTKVVFVNPSPGICYTAGDAVDWCFAPTA